MQMNPAPAGFVCISRLPGIGEFVCENYGIQTASRVEARKGSRTDSDDRLGAYMASEREVTAQSRDPLMHRVLHHRQLRIASRIASQQAAAQRCTTPHKST